MNAKEYDITTSESIQKLEKKYSVLKTKFNVLLITGILTAIVFSFRKLYEKSITVERINVVEPNGKLRMVISNKNMSPGNFYYGKEFIK